MGFIKKTFAAIFSTEFLIKILLIAFIFVVVKYLDEGFLRISINHTHTIKSGYDGFEVTIKEKK